MFPPKLKPGDGPSNSATGRAGVRVIAPSCSLPSLPWMTDGMMKKAKAFFESRGLHVSESKHLREIDDFESSSIASRIEDLHDAFRDPSIQMLVTIRGGFSSNQLLRYLDYDLIQKNPKILCGFSDITALGNAIYAKTGLVTYSGANFYHFGFGPQMAFTHEFFEKCLMHDKPFALRPSDAWSNDHFSPERPDFRFEPNDGWWQLQDGSAEGTLLGGNLCTLNLLQGTEFMPDLNGSVLFLEDDYESLPRHVDRNLQSLIHLPEFAGVRGLVIGRFEKKTGMTRDLLEQIIRTKPELKKMPVIANVDFGHTHPMITFPIGGTVRMKAAQGKAMIEILTH